jgi:hypothetical protein
MESGFYWVRVKYSKSVGDWVVGRYVEHLKIFQIPGVLGGFAESGVEVLGTRLPPPNNGSLKGYPTKLRRRRVEKKVIVTEDSET